MIVFKRSESASHVCGCSGCTQCAATGYHYILVDGVTYFATFICREGQTEPYYLEAGETEAKITADDTRWILWD